MLASTKLPGIVEKGTLNGTIHFRSTATMTKRILILMALSSLLWANATQAGNDRQPLAEISQAVERFLEDHFSTENDSKVRITVSPLDPRLNLAACDQPLSVNAGDGQPRHGGRLTAQVRCDGRAPWRIYVPARIEQLRPVVVARETLNRGEVIQAGQLAQVEHDINSALRGYHTDPAELVGMVATRQINANSVITPADVAREQIIRRGDRVTLVSENRGFSVSARGEALTAAGVGDRLRVRNLNSQRIVEGIVQSRDEVRISMP